MRTTNISFTALSHKILSGTDRLDVWGMFCHRFCFRELHMASANNWPGVVYFVRHSSGWISQLQQTDPSCTPAAAYHSFSIYSLPNVLTSHILNCNYGSYGYSKGSPPPVTPEGATPPPQYRRLSAMYPNHWKWKHSVRPAWDKLASISTITLQTAGSPHILCVFSIFIRSQGRLHRDMRDHSKGLCQARS